MRVLKRELLLSYRKRAEYIYALLFFVIVVTLFPLSITPNPRLLQVIGPGIIWVAVLLSTTLALNHVFRDDYQDGSLEQMILSSQDLVFLMSLKLLAQWLIFVVPMIVIAPVLAFLLHLSSHAIFVLISTLLLGSPILIFIGSVVAALTVGLRNGGVLMIFILLPLYVPTLIFGSQAVFLAQNGDSIAAPLAWLSALLMLTLMIVPFVSAAALRMGVAYD